MGLETSTINLLITSGMPVVGTLLGTFLGGWLQFQREQYQWQRQKELEREKWERDNLLNITRNCISSITAYLQSRRAVTFDPKVSPGLYPIPEFEPNVVGVSYNSELYGQVKAWLTLLLIYHPAKETQEYIDFENGVKALGQGSVNLTELLDKIVALAMTFTAERAKDSSSKAPRVGYNRSG